MWRDSDSDSSDNTVYHNQGTSCLSCHKAPATGAEGYSFLSGGTIYTELNATTAAQYATGYTIRALLDTNLSINYISGRGYGNSRSQDTALSNDYNFTAQVVNSSGVVVNSSATNSHSTASNLDCNVCHTAAGANGAPGRIHIATPVVTSGTPL
ncbi:MAG: hypothetical protein Q9M40_08180 [Sulfurimonas sp.]|nr:hypothetical protein [Sulfurimonas sp.]